MSIRVFAKAITLFELIVQSKKNFSGISAETKKDHLIVGSDSFIKMAELKLLLDEQKIKWEI